MHNSGGASEQFEAAPAIVPGNDSLRLFWVSWRHPINGGQLTVVDSTCAAKYAPPAQVRKYLGGTPKFVSLATYKNSDTVHIAWEESVSGATDIYYTNAVAGKGVIVVSPPKIISQLIGNTDCDEYHFPQITVTKNGIASVVWEGAPQKVEKLGYNIFKHYLYERDRNKGGWNATTLAFQAITDTIYGTGAVYSAHLFGNIGTSDTVYFDTTGAWSSTWMRLLWNDSASGRFGLAQYGRNDINFGAPLIRSWEYFQMIEPSLEPALPMFHRYNDIARPVLYREVTNEGISIAKITQYDYPKTSVAQTNIPRLQLQLRPDVACAHIRFNGGLAQMAVTHDTNHAPIGVAPFGRSGNTLDDLSPIDWNDHRFRTDAFGLVAGDTITYDRYFQVGNYTVGDTSAAAAYLADSNDYAKISIQLRQRNNDSLLKVLDSAVLSRRYGFSQSPLSGLGTGGKYICTMSPSDLVYISIEASRGNSGDSLKVYNLEIFNSDMKDMLAPDDASYKTAGPSSPTSNAHNDPVSVSVVPNPFTHSTNICLNVSKDIPLNVTVYDALGRKITELWNGVADHSQYQFTLSNHELAAGSYFLRISSGHSVETRKIELLK